MPLRKDKALESGWAKFIFFPTVSVRNVLRTFILKAKESSSGLIKEGEKLSRGNEHKMRAAVSGLSYDSNRRVKSGKEIRRVGRDDTHDH